jgi:hypothetical protein
MILLPGPDEIIFSSVTIVFMKQFLLARYTSCLLLSVRQFTGSLKTLPHTNFVTTLSQFYIIRLTVCQFIPAFGINTGINDCKMKKHCCLLFIICLSITAMAHQQAPAQQSADDYTKVITQRAEKIVNTLHIAEPETKEKVQAIIVQQYRDLNDIHESHNAQVKTIREQKTAEKPVDEASIQQIEDDRMTQLKKVHDGYLSKLSTHLTPQQVDQVKDGMTYNVLHVTYKAYQDMILQLTEEQKKQIYTWLVEAREYAMDAESSDKKHAWFGKYKGRINNYLSAAGYDMRKEEKGWQQRLREQREAQQKSK